MGRIRRTLDGAVPLVRSFGQRKFAYGKGAERTLAKAATSISRLRVFHDELSLSAFPKLVCVGPTSPAAVDRFDGRASFSLRLNAR